MNSDQQPQFKGMKESTMTRSHHLYFNIEENDDFEQFSARLLDGDLSKKHKLLKYLASKCFLGMKMYDEVIKLASSALNCDPDLINYSTVATTSGSYDKIRPEINHEECELYDNLSKEWKTDAGLYLQLGIAYESVDNRVQARLAYEKCLKKDVYRFEALKRLNDRHLLTETQKTSLLNDLPFKEQCSDEEGQLLRIIYSAMIKQEPLSTVKPQTADQNESNDLIEIRNVLSHNPSLLVAEAQLKYEKSDYRYL
uniref:Uncharacterized protein n=1 Tax=Romanomermis culicivorax TaxID=13658 RepID=A0A915I9J6_ROMCU